MMSIQWKTTKKDLTLDLALRDLRIESDSTLGTCEHVFLIVVFSQGVKHFIAIASVGHDVTSETRL